jgi:hypothetical protein
MPILTGELVASTRKSKLVRKVGTNRLISRKIVSFSFSEEVVTTSIPSLLRLESTIWCPRQDLNLYDVTH